MDLNFLFFELGETLRFIFKVNYIPTRKDFKELTRLQYAAFFATASKEDIALMDNTRLFAFIPDSATVKNQTTEIDLPEHLFIVTEDEIAIFEKTSKFIDHLIKTSGREDINTVSEKLGYIAQILPDVFSKGTSYSHSAPKEEKEADSNIE